MFETDRPLRSILSDIVANLQGIVRSELRLAKAEIRAEAQGAGSALVRIGLGAGAAFFAAFFLLLGLVYFLARFMPLWLSAAAVGALLGIAAVFAIQSGRRLFQQVDVVPPKTAQSIKEQLTWPTTPST